MLGTHFRRVSPFKNSLGMAVSLGLIIGCGDVADESDDKALSEPQEILSPATREFDRGALIRATQSLGYDEDAISIQDGYVVADGDLILDSAKLLDGQYLPKDDQSSTVQKGYRSNPVTVGPTNIELWWSTTNPPDAAMKAAFEDAADQWSYQPNTNIWINRFNSGQQIVVHQVSSLPTGCTGQGCTDLPTSGNVGGNVYVLQTPTGVPGCSAWNPSWRTWIALHELGHAIAFEHPGTHTYIAGTCRTSPVNCSTADYPTVMRASAPLIASCASSVTALQPDDILSVQTVYP